MPRQITTTGLFKTDVHTKNEARPYDHDHASTGMMKSIRLLVLIVSTAVSLRMGFHDLCECGVDEELARRITGYVYDVSME